MCSEKSIHVEIYWMSVTEPKGAVCNGRVLDTFRSLENGKSSVWYLLVSTDSFDECRASFDQMLVFECAQATTDPGLVVRRSEEPTGEDRGVRHYDFCRRSTNNNLNLVGRLSLRWLQGARWAYCDRTKTWRPTTAKYADDCNVLVDKYDHTCPWTGTAIGGNNMKCVHM